VAKYDAMSARCPSRDVLAHISDKWTVLVLAVLVDGTTRFNELRRRIDGITQKMLTRTLRELEENGFVSRRIYAEVPPRVEYSLTPLGQSLVKVLDTVREWVNRHAGDVVTARERFAREQALRAASGRRGAGARGRSARATA
jgi:DNA-binding HxlR family transcriptional regulator